MNIHSSKATKAAKAVRRIAGAAALVCACFLPSGCAKTLYRDSERVRTDSVFVYIDTSAVRHSAINAILSSERILRDSVVVRDSIVVKVREDGTIVGTESYRLRDRLRERVSSDDARVAKADTIRSGVVKQGSVSVNETRVVERVRQSPGWSVGWSLVKGIFLGWCLSVVIPGLWRVLKKIKIRH